MKAFKAEDLRAFAQALFTRDTFDSFLVSEAQVKTFCTFHVNGKTERNWYSDEELEEERIEDYAAWKKVRPFVFGFIRGNRTPESFRVTLRLAPEAAEAFLRETGHGESGEEAGGFFLNFRFEEKILTCVSVASLNLFPPDRTLEERFDLWTQEFFRQHGLPVSEL